MGRHAVAVVVTAAAYVAATLLAVVVGNPGHPWFSTLRIVLAVVAGAVGALALGPLSGRLRLPALVRLAVLAVLAYLIGTVSNAVEALLFIKGSSPVILATGLLPALALAVPLALLWPSGSPAAEAGEALRRAAATRPWWSWTWRFVVTALAWVPIYLLFAAADAPFVHRYYAQSGTPFHVPSGGVVASAELLRGLLHAAVLGLLAALLLRAGAVSARRTRVSTWWWLALTFAVLNGWLPLIQRSDWPAYLRAANAVEITCDAVVYGGLVVLLLTRRTRSPEPVASDARS